MRSKYVKSTKNKQAKVRIIGGQWRSRMLNVIDLPGLRPSGDRVRETLFNWLAPHIYQAKCLDMFAGTGALGLEALSREAAFVDFFEKNALAATQLKNNLNLLTTDSEHRAHVSNADAMTLLQRIPSSPYDIVFLDPPFSESLWGPATARLCANQWLHDDSLIYIECPKNQQNLALSPEFTLVKQKTIGQVQFALYRKTKK